MFKAGQQHKICTVKHSLFELWSDKEVRERRENVGRSDISKDGNLCHR